MPQQDNRTTGQQDNRTTGQQDNSTSEIATSADVEGWVTDQAKFEALFGALTVPTQREVLGLDTLPPKLIEQIVADFRITEDSLSITVQLKH
jgi:hypothetical protein